MSRLYSRRRKCTDDPKQEGDRSERELNDAARDAVISEDESGPGVTRNVAIEHEQGFKIAKKKKKVQQLGK